MPVTTLQKILDHIGFDPRPQQTQLYEQLLATDDAGAVVQAGTGTGKSLAVLAAAIDWHERTGEVSLVVTPTNVLMDQYLTTDAPRVREALPGVRIEALKGRNRYLCLDAPAFSSITPNPPHIASQTMAMQQILRDPDQIFEPEDTKYFGCPGSEGHTTEDDGAICHYRRAKARAQEADVVVTNSHLLIINSQMKNGVMGDIPPIWPEVGVVLVDECHELESSLRDFATRSIPQSAVAGFGLGRWLFTQAAKSRDSQRITPDGELVGHLIELRDSQMDELERGYKAWLEARGAAQYILDRGLAGAYANNAAVLWVDPPPPGNQRMQAKLVSTQIDLSAAARGLLTAQPFGLVSATVPRTLREALGIPDAAFVDVGHPFDYARQASIGFSQLSGAYRAETPGNKKARLEEIAERVLELGGGSLLLFSSYKAMNEAYDELWPRFMRAGLTVLRQERDSDKRALGERFKADGNAVLFGTDSFATGFDAPGDALRFVSIWKVPYPGLDPVTTAISDRSRARYTDLALMKLAQAAGRLVRTPSDVGAVWVADSRARPLMIGSGDPMLAHFDQFQLTGPPPAYDDSY